MVFGLVETGFLPKRLADVKADLEDAWRAQFGANADVSPQSPDGQVIGVVSEQIALLWELAEKLHQAESVMTASGTQLDEWAQIAGLMRLAATNSTVTLPCTGTTGTVLTAGRRISLDGSGSTWVLTAEITIVEGGTDGIFEAEVEGATQALADSDWNIETPVSGWDVVGPNASDAELGRSRETDSALRVRIVGGMFAPGNSLDAIRSAIARLDTVTEIVVAENHSAIADSEGRPGKSFETLVLGGDEDEIAEAIWDNKPAGIEAYGESVTKLVEDEYGNFHEVKFTRPSDVEIYLEIDLEVDETFPVDGTDLVLEEVLAYEDELKIGTDVIPWRIKRLIETQGILELTLRVGTLPNPAAEQTIAIGSRERATLDSSRIEVVVI